MVKKLVLLPFKLVKAVWDVGMWFVNLIMTPQKGKMYKTKSGKWRKKR